MIENVTFNLRLVFQVANQVRYRIVTMGDESRDDGPARPKPGLSLTPSLHAVGRVLDRLPDLAIQVEIQQLVATLDLKSIYIVCGD